MVIVRYTFRGVFSRAACCFDLAGSVLFKTLYSVWLGRALTAYGASASKRSLGLLGLKARNLLAALGVAVYIFFFRHFFGLLVDREQGPIGPFVIRSIHSLMANRAPRKVNPHYSSLLLLPVLPHPAYNTYVVDLLPDYKNSATNRPTD